jgi:uncharacterized membrane protein
MKISAGFPYYLVVEFLLILNLSILAPPFLIFAGFEDAAASLYNIHSYDHQWIYRSQCVFKDSAGNLLIEDCIIQGEEAEANISTRYTKNGDIGFNGVFSSYTQDEIGRNKAEKVVRNGMVGYKFANDTRDYSIYIPWMLTMIIHPFIFGPRYRKVPSSIWLMLALVPMGIDGTFQAFGFWESTNLMRMITGAIAGIGAGIFTVPMLNNLVREEGKDGK